MKEEKRPAIKSRGSLEEEEEYSSISAQIHDIDTRAETARRELESQERQLKIQKNYDIAFQVFVFLVLVFVVGPEIRDLLYEWIASCGR